jgi:hypothetical protein
MSQSGLVQLRVWHQQLQSAPWWQTSRGDRLPRHLGATFKAGTFGFESAHNRRGTRDAQPILNQRAVVREPCRPCQHCAIQDSERIANRFRSTMQMRRQSATGVQDNVVPVAIRHKDERYSRTRLSHALGWPKTDRGCDDGSAEG